METLEILWSKTTVCSLYCDPIHSISDKIDKTKVRGPTESEKFLFHFRLIINFPILFKLT